MAEHKWSFVHTAWEMLRNALSTSDLSIIVFSVCVPLSVFIVAVAVKWRSGDQSVNGFVQALRDSIKPALIGVAVTLAAWAALFSWALYRSIYNDHQNLAGRLRAVVNEKDALKRGLQVRDQYIHSLEQKPVEQTPGRILSRMSAVEKRCWVANHRIIPGPEYKEAIIGTEVLIHCNYKIDAPFKIAVEFDQDFVLIPGAVEFAERAGFAGYEQEKQGRVLLAQIGGPALLSDHFVVITVLGATQEFPVALKGSIISLQ